jgi:hypothetical protein
MGGRDRMPLGVRHTKIKMPGLRQNHGSASPRMSCAGFSRDRASSATLCSVRKTMAVT